MDKLELVKSYGEYANYIYQDVLKNDWELKDYETKNEDGLYEENMYIADDNDYIELVKIALEIKEKIHNKEIKLYNGLLELNDNHTLWEIESRENLEENYPYELAKKLLQFEKTTDTEIFTEGRMGRHICVHNTMENACNYDYLCEVQQKLGQELIDRFS